MPTKFQNKVYKICKKVPKGKVTTYKAIAKVMGNKAYRAVGSALNKNPYAPRVPCHRVINTNGNLGGFASGLKNKIKLLKKEGVQIKNNKIDKKYIIKLK
jgi:methylated-DNA-[protein]-cysteine S-methyltransferase|tara:strand:+ start:792 stop:1091 length:300 start_codon:yes stop_codon:yes gene_type:complete